MNKILIVDDEKEIRAVVQEFLQLKGYKTILVKSGALAKEKLKEDKNISLMILDNKMPGETGMDLLKEIRKDGGTLPVIILTGSIGIPDEEVSDHNAHLLRKPISLNTLLSQIKSLMPDQAA